MKEIIVLTTTQPWPGQNSIQFVMWASVPTARQQFYVQPSTWKSSYAGATTTEIVALQSGSFTEQVQTINLPIGTPVATVKSVLQDTFTKYQDSITNNNNWQFYGSFWDGTTWTIGGF